MIGALICYVLDTATQVVPYARYRRVTLEVSRTFRKVDPFPIIARWGYRKALPAS